MYTLFQPKQGEVEGQPYAAASMALEVSEEMQYRIEGFIEAEVERYADEIADDNEEPAEPSGGEDDSDAGVAKRAAKRSEPKVLSSGQSSPHFSSSIAERVPRQHSIRPGWRRNMSSWVRSLGFSRQCVQASSM